MSANLLFSLNYRPQGDWIDVDKRDTIWTSLILTSYSQPIDLSTICTTFACCNKIHSDWWWHAKSETHGHVYMCEYSIARGSDPPLYQSIDLDSSGVRRLGIQHTHQLNLPAKWHSPINSKPQVCDVSWSCWVWGGLRLIEDSIFLSIIGEV